jgi:hypothetical protein
MFAKRRHCFNLCSFGACALFAILTFITEHHTRFFRSYNAMSQRN